ncbi:NUDIX hydrolase [Actinocorallia populi]|uniref:NUDIX hydrolase n=1 Tax=Actinocorallia populi TaxID=2079200 RepID=UPI000D08A958|nr:NUDIX hydrolase [Actinocorallia populi]
MDGDGFTRCERGHTHWGRFGAAGLLLFSQDHVLLQQRAWWCNGGGTWCLFGGGRHAGEDAVTAALRETTEESSLDVSIVRLHGRVKDDHGGWSYTTMIGSAPERTPVRGESSETKAARWVPVSEVDTLRLFAPFGDAWPTLRSMLTRVVLIVDAANVMGSRPDGWWRDRLGAARRLRDGLAGLGPVSLGPFDEAYPELVLVVEGAARPLESAGGVRVVAAPGSGDDEIVAQVRQDGAYHVVVTADRELRRRCEEAGAQVVGPRWLLDRLA